VNLVGERLVGQYVRLGLSFDRLERGFVDVWTGPPQVRAEVESGPVPAPQELGRRARELRQELPSAGLAPDRARWLEGQLTGLECSARVLAGEPVGWVDQVEAFFQVRPELGDEAVYADAHAELELLLPGDGPLLERYTTYRAGTAIPPQRLPEAVREVSTLLRERARAAFALPEAETVEYEIVDDRPWAGFNYYLGGFRSTVAINADLPVGLGALPALLAHESYPGHHTERCRKQVAHADLPEYDLWLVNTPENLMAEGLADLGLAGLDLLDWGSTMTELYRDLGLPYDGERGQRIARAVAPLGAARQDAALLLHDRGAPAEQAEAHLARWALQSPDRAAKTVGFLRSPLWRAYMCTYVEGERLLSRWLAERPAGAPAGARFVRLLDEQLTPAAVRDELARSPAVADVPRVAGAG
jgi:hypothetical protein